MEGTMPQWTGFRVCEKFRNQMQSVQRLGQVSISFRRRIPAEKWQRGSDNSIFMEFLNRETTICKQNVSKLPRSATLITTYMISSSEFFLQTTCLSLLQRSLFIGGKEQQELQHKTWAKRGGRISL